MEAAIPYRPGARGRQTKDLHDTMAFNEYDTITRIALRHARDAFRNPEAVEGQWQALNYHGAPAVDAAIREYDEFVDALQLESAVVHDLGSNAALGMDSIYVRDSAVPSPKGLILANMGKPARTGEPQANAGVFKELGIQLAGSISGEGCLEGGDFVWFDDTTCAVAHGYRTNAEGIRQLRALLGEEVHLEVCPLPHYKGPEDVFHLMSILSPLDRDLALVYSPLMPVPFRQWLLERGLALVEVPPEEFELMGCNVLATAPRRCVMLDGNPLTRRALERAGCEVHVYAGNEISRKGEGGPTCLTRPLERAPGQAPYSIS